MANLGRFVGVQFKNSREFLDFQVDFIMLPFGSGMAPGVDRPFEWRPPPANFHAAWERSADRRSRGFRIRRGAERGDATHCAEGCSREQEHPVGTRWLGFHEIPGRNPGNMTS